MAANPTTDQLAAAVTVDRQTRTPRQQAVGDELARRMMHRLPDTAPATVGEVMLYLGHFVLGMTDQARAHPDTMTADELGSQPFAAITLAGERLYTGAPL